MNGLKNAFTGRKNVNNNANNRFNNNLVALNEEKSVNVISAEDQKLNDKEKWKHYVLKIVYKEHAVRESAVAKVFNTPRTYLLILLIYY